VGNTFRSANSGALTAVHPHARGEHRAQRGLQGGVVGSSPRTWGTLAVLGDAAAQGRFIPTHVGNTGTKAPTSARRAVHPHARGEHKRMFSASRAVCGSSPRTWGTLPHPRRLLTQRRFIPTHVGNTGQQRHCPRVRPVHPHARGEHQHGLAGLGHQGGSSPRTWGTLIGSGDRQFFARFIPTHVGNTCGEIPTETPTPVHPHARGEHQRLWGAG